MFFQHKEPFNGTDYAYKIKQININFSPDEEKEEEEEIEDINYHEIPIITLLHNARNHKIRELREGHEAIIALLENDHAFIESSPFEEKINGNVLTFPFPRVSDLLDAIYVTNENGEIDNDLIEEIAISGSDGIIKYRRNKFNKIRYTKNGNQIEANLIADHPIPIISITDDGWLQVKLKKIADIHIVGILVNMIIRNHIARTLFELDLDEEQFLLYGYGASISHFCGDLSYHLKQLMKEARHESMSRKIDL